jgi:hypothetical protein
VADMFYRIKRSKGKTDDFIRGGEKVREIMNRCVRVEINGHHTRKVIASF